MKTAPRRRPEVEALESLRLLSTFVAGPHQAVSTTILPARSNLVAPPVGQLQAHSSTVGVNLSVGRPAISPGLSGRARVVSSTVINSPGHVSIASTSPSRLSVSTNVQAGPGRLGSPSVHAMIVPSQSRPVIVTQVTGRVVPSTPTPAPTPAHVATSITVHPGPTASPRRF